MPVTRTRTTKKTTMRPRRKYVRKSRMNFAQRVKAVIKSQQETKSAIYNVGEIGQNTLSSPNLTFSLNNLDQGVDGHNRIGDSVNGMLMNVRGSVQCAHNQGIIHRILVIEKNRQSDPLGDLLEDNSGNFGPAQQDIRAIYARINTTKYKVLAQRVFHTGRTSSVVDDLGGTKIFNMTFKTPGKYLYDDGSVIAQKRQIVLIWFCRRSNNDESTGDSAEISINAKWYFKDA